MVLPGSWSTPRQAVLPKGRVWVGRGGGLKGKVRSCPFSQLAPSLRRPGPSLGEMLWLPGEKGHFLGVWYSLDRSTQWALLFLRGKPAAVGAHACDGDAREQVS